MERTQKNLNVVMNMEKRELLDQIICISMHIAEEKFLTDELLTDEFITKKEEAYIDSVNILHKHFRRYCKESIRELIFRKTTLMTFIICRLKNK